MSEVKRSERFIETVMPLKNSHKILDHRGIVLSDPIGAIAHLELARAYTFTNDKDKARAEYREFLNLWQSADPKTPVLNHAKAEYAKLK